VSEPDFRPGDVVTPARRGYGRPTPLHPGGVQLEAGKPVTVLAALGGGWVEIRDSHGRMCEVHAAFLAAGPVPPPLLKPPAGLFDEETTGGPTS
jgi:hypothetical protein